MGLPPQNFEKKSVFKKNLLKYGLLTVLFVLSGCDALSKFKIISARRPASFL
jgi:hypothetical protein